MTVEFTVHVTDIPSVLATYWAHEFYFSDLAAVDAAQQVSALMLGIESFVALRQTWHIATSSGAIERDSNQGGKIKGGQASNT